MGLLQNLSNEQAYCKIGIFGFPKSGKSYTAAVFAVGIRQHFGHGGQIAFYDTEGGSNYVAPWIKNATGKELIGVRSRSFDDLMATADECIKGGISVLVVDSITHPWTELKDAYLAEINKKRRGRGLKWDKTSLEFQDWGIIKGRWSKWTELYLNSPLHIVICGRAGMQYEYEKNDDTGKRELVTTGRKMKTEAEFGFEPSLLIEMEHENRDGKYWHKATVVGDRFNVIDGQVGYNPTFEFIKPHVELLSRGDQGQIDMEVRSELGVDEDGQGEWRRKKKQIEIILEEIQELIKKYFPSQSAGDKKSRIDRLEGAFQTRSWSKVETMRLDELEAGFDFLKVTLAEKHAEAESTA